MSEWKPIYNTTLRAFGLYRVIDTTKADTPGNREYHPYGAIFTDRETAERAARELNHDD